MVGKGGQQGQIVGERANNQLTDTWRQLSGTTTMRAAPPSLVGDDDPSDGDDDRIFDSLFGGMCSPFVDGRCRPDAGLEGRRDQAGNN